MAVVTEASGRALSRTAEPPLSLTGLVVAVYAFILVGGVCAALITMSGAALMYVSAGVITMALIYFEQAALLAWIGDRVSAYTLSCDALGGACSVRAAFAGRSPAAPSVFQMPSATAQLLAMAAAYWTIHAVRVGDGSPTSKVRATGLWVVVAATLSYATAFQLVTVRQVAIGLLLGTGIGSVFYKLLPQADDEADD